MKDKCAHLSLTTLLLSVSSGALALGLRENLPWVDISRDATRQIVFAAGTPELYKGHPTTVSDRFRIEESDWLYGSRY